VPEASDLRGSGISPAEPGKVADISATETALAEAWKPKAVGRNGALIDGKVEVETEEEVKSKRRRTVSKVRPDGTVPVVLGGRMPPMSALPSNQRAFGLRQARR
jgi:hypothetical protein